MSINITEMGQCSLADLANGIAVSSFDVGVVAYGADSRSTHVLTQLRRSFDHAIAVKKSSIGRESSMEVSFERRYSARILDIDNACVELMSITQNRRDNSLSTRIFLDVSSLSRICLGKIFACLKIISMDSVVYLSIGYSLARYAAPPDQPFPSIRRLAPVHREFSGWGSSPSLPVDVIVSLGYEKGKAIGAVEYLEPRNRWVFVPNSPEQRFLQQVKNHNKQLIGAGDCVIDYEVLEPVDTYFKLMSLVVGLAPAARPVLLPFGPKLFFALGLLVAMRIEKAAVWHVDSDDEMSAIPLAPSGHGVVFSCRLSGLVSSA